MGDFEESLGSWFSNEFLGIQESIGVQIREIQPFMGARSSGFLQGCQDNSFGGKRAGFQGRNPL